jgi:RimJ/RimL family protein N-acetyltransferase
MYRSKGIVMRTLNLVPSATDHLSSVNSRSGFRRGRFPPARVELDDGTRVDLRAATTEDDAARRTFYDQLSDHARYLRFLQPVPRMTDALFRVVADPAHHTVIAHDGRKVVADAMLVVDRHDPTSAEIAYAVADGVRRRGLGRAVVDRLLDIAARIGVCHVHAVMSAENHPSAALMRSFGARPRFEDGLLVARLTVCPARAAA